MDNTKKAAALGLADTYIEEKQYMISDRKPCRVRTVQSHAVYSAMVESMDTAVAPGGTVETPAINMDIFPTVLEFAGMPVPAGIELDGCSLLPLLRGGAAPARDALFWHYPHDSNQGGFPGGAVLMDGWKLVENYEDGSIGLYHLRDDPGEQHDLANVQPERVRVLRARLHAWYRETGARFLDRVADGLEPWRS